jgi:hypothetical protein
MSGGLRGSFGRNRRSAAPRPGIIHSETMTTVDVGRSKQWTSAGTARAHIVGDPMRDTVRQDDTVPDPLAGDGDGAELRSAPRFTLLIRAAKLVGSDCEFLCVVRDASESGVSVRLFHPLPPGMPLTLELPNGDRHLLECVWEESGKAGFRFREPADIERIVEGPSRFAKRAVRVNLEVRCLIEAGGRRFDGTLRNLSQQGAQICTGERLSLIQRVKLTAHGLPEIAAKVRWRRNDCYGLSFEDTFQFAELAALAFDLQRAAERQKRAAEA